MSRSDAWMPFYVTDYLGDTGHLSGPEHGAYLLLLFHYWRTGPLPDDDALLARLEALDVGTGTWRSLPVMMPAIHGTGAAAVDGVIHVPGGATVMGFGAVAQHRVLRMRP